MSERAWGVYRLLRRPSMYEALQSLIRPEASYRRFIERHVRPKEGMRVLDIGCGTGAILSYLPSVDYIGIDANADYVQRARRRFGARATFHVCDAAGRIDVADQSVDLVLALGVLHHLSDAVAKNVVAEAARVLVPGGRFVSHDPVRGNGASLAARIFVALDRGKHVRTQPELLELVGKEFAEIQSFTSNNSLRIPFQEIILESSLPRPVKQSGDESLHSKENSRGIIKLPRHE